VLGLDAFTQAHADVKGQVEAWLAEVRDSSWATPHELKARYPRASMLSGNRVVFNLKGNRYRLLVRVNYKNGIVVVERIGTHAEYDDWNL